MKMKTSILLLTSVIIVFGYIAVIEQPSLAENVMFYCDQSRGSPTTFVRTQDGVRLPVIRWVSNFGLSSEWTPEKRCQQVSQRFQMSHNRGMLRYIKPGSIRGIPVICATLQPDSPCSEQTLLFTLKPGSNPVETFRRLMDRRALASGNALEQSSGKELFIDVNKYLLRSGSKTENK